MPSYENEKCPVCNIQFTAEDDIVTCPKCGTPHHRECYNKTGHCANWDKHAAGFDYQNEAARHDESNDSQAHYYYNPNKENENNINNNESTQQERPSPFIFLNEAPPKEIYDENAMLEDVSLNDVSAVVRTKTESFIPKFLSQSKTSWSWAGLIFGPFYLFYRKMYKEGTVFLAIRLIITLVAQGIYSKPYNAIASFLTENSSALSSPTEEFLTEFTQLYQPLIPMFAIIIGGIAILHIIIALFADNIYKKTVINVIKKVDEKLSEGGEFAQAPLFMSENPSLSQKDMKRLYLSKLGGTTLLSPVTAFLVYDLLTRLVSQINL